MPGVKFAISYSTPHHGADPERLVAFARHAEMCGFEGFYLPEHIALHPGDAVGPMELPTDLSFPDPLDCLAFVAAATGRIRLGTAVLLLPYHQPVVLAKRLATIDVLSGGRMRLLTVGLGTLPREAAAIGVDFRSRGRRANEAIEVLRLLWAGETTYAGEFFVLDGTCVVPRPHGGDILPVHVGGSSDAAARRAGRLGDGFFPGGALMPDERARQLRLAHEAAAAAGRDPAALEYTRWGSIEITDRGVAAYAEQGVTRIVVPATSIEEMSAFAERHLS